MRRAMRARELPDAARSASCVGRTFTAANSAATKKPFARMKTRARSRYQVGMLSGRGHARDQGPRPWWSGILTITMRLFLITLLLASSVHADEVDVAAAASL